MNGKKVCGMFFIHYIWVIEFRQSINSEYFIFVYKTGTGFRKYAVIISKKSWDVKAQKLAN